MLSEGKRHGIASRFGQKRADVVHQAMDPFIVAGPWVVGGVLGYRTVRRLIR